MNKLDKVYDGLSEEIRSYEGADVIGPNVFNSIADEVAKYEAEIKRLTKEKAKEGLLRLDAYARIVQLEAKVRWYEKKIGWKIGDAEEFLTGE